MKEKKNVSKNEAIGAAVGASALSQLSRNKNIRNAGGTLGIFAVMILIGEGIKWLLKWLLWKPCVFIVKLFYNMFIWGSKGIWYICKLLYGLIKVSTLKLIEYIKVKKAAK